MKAKHFYIPDIENIEASDSIIGAFDVDFIEPENLLFQAGYLTVQDQRSVGGKTFYKLQYPNMEVKGSLSDSILNRYSPDQVLKEKAQLRIYQTLLGNDLEFDRRKRNIRSLRLGTGLRKRGCKKSFCSR